MAPIIQRRMVPASVITSTSATLSVRIRTHCVICALAVPQRRLIAVMVMVFRCVMVEMVKRVTGVDFKVEIAPRRPGDPAQIVAASDRARAMLGWTPQYNDLATIIAHALAWEQKLQRQVLMAR